MRRAQLSAVLMLICGLKCLAIPRDELEDFEDYITRTSQLSPILKKGVEADEVDEDEVLSDNAWEQSGKFEGDLILNDRQRRLIVENVAEGLSRNGLRDGTKRWPNGEVIFYIQVEHFTNEQVQAIHSGIEDLARASCVTFRPYRRGDRDAVVIQGSRRGCFSQVGYQGGYQVLNLSGRHPVGRGCFRHGTIVHEMLHTLGFYHMQSSPERDDYVDVQWNNIIQKARHNFRKYNSFSVSNFGIEYDYDSVLHYSRRAFSVNGQDTLVPKKSGVEIGQRVGLSEKDAQKLNKMYCNADADAIPADENNKAKKKSYKNKPLDIYGIGYHQGKAVIIKVLPKVEEPMLPAMRPFYQFDYFSKPPQILPSPEKENLYVGKKIAKLYTPLEPINKHEYQVPVDKKAVPEKIFFAEPVKKNDVINLKQVKNATTTIHSQLKKERVMPLIPLHNNNDDVEDSTYIEPFDRLTKIIQSHVYPSQNPDLSIYKINKQNIESKDTLKEIPVAQKQESVPQTEKMISAMHFINNFYDPNNQQYKRQNEDYQPKTKEKVYYEVDSKDNNKKPEFIIIADMRGKEDKGRAFKDLPYITSLFNHEDDYNPKTYYRPEKNEKYSSKLQQVAKSDDDDWHHTYTPYKYNPTEYDSSDNTEYVKLNGVKHEYYNPSLPIRLKEYIYRNPYESNNYNEVTERATFYSQEER